MVCPRSEPPLDGNLVMGEEVVVLVRGEVVVEMVVVVVMEVVGKSLGRAGVRRFATRVLLDLKMLPERREVQ